MSASSSKPLISQVTVDRYLDGTRCSVWLNKECDGLPMMVGEFFIRKMVDSKGRRFKLDKEMMRVWEEVQGSLCNRLTDKELETLKKRIYMEFAISRKVRRVNWTRIALQF